MLAAALVAAIALSVIGLGLGWLFALLTVALVIAPLVLGDGSPNAGAALLGPGWLLG